MTLRRARRIANTALVVVLAAFIVVSVLARVRSGQATSPAGIPAPLAVGTELQRPHHVSSPATRASSTQLASLAVIQGMPMTLYLNRAGKVIWRHIGQYQSLGSLENDIEHYALGVAG